MVTTATNPPPTTPTTPSQGSSNDQQVHERDTDLEGPRRYRQRPVSAPHEHGDMADASASEPVRVPCPRRGDGRDGHVVPVTNHVSATLSAGPDGELWVTVDGADIHQLAARISAVCDVLNREQPPR